MRLQGGLSHPSRAAFSRLVQNSVVKLNQVILVFSAHVVQSYSVGKTASETISLFMTQP